MTASSLASLQIPFRTLSAALFAYVAAADHRVTIDGPIALLRVIGSSGLPAIRISQRVCAKSGRVLHAARPVTVECFFDYSSPRTYLGCHQLHGMRAQYPNATCVFRPMPVGGIFNSVNPFVCAIPLAPRYMCRSRCRCGCSPALAVALRSYEIRKAAPVPAKAR